MSTLTVGANQQYSTIADAVNASSSGDTINVQAGTYTNDFVSIGHDLTLNAVGGAVTMNATRQPPNGKAILTEGGSGITVNINGFVFTGATVPDQNGAGLRYEGGTLHVTNSGFFNNENGILGAADPNGVITVDHSDFGYNGVGGAGYTHNMYIGDIASFSLTNSFSHDANVGHEVKSRAENNIITGNTILDNNSSSSYEIDLPNGGNTVISGNTIQQGPNSQNPNIIAYGEEGNLHAGTSLAVIGNIMVNDMGRGPALWNATGRAATFADNSVNGFSGNSLVNGPANQSGTTVLADRPPLVETVPSASVTTPAPVTTPTPVPTPTPAPTAGPDTVVVNASASLAGGMGAHFNLVVDGATIGSATVDSTTTQAYSFSTTLAGGSSAAHDIQVLFDNDAVINGQDRNLYLQSISVDGQAMAATDGREVYHATGSASTGFGPGDVASNGNMYWQGAAEFKLPAAATVPTPTPAPTAGPDTVVVNVSASLAGGMGAHFNLVVDGATIGSATVDSTTTQAYSFSTTLAGGSSAAHDIQVLFDNDAVINGQDRNLYLQSISVDGQAMAATDGREVYHATGSASTGFGPGDVASNGNMYWQGAAEFKLPAAATVPTPTPAPTAGPDTVVVNASASLAGGMGAHFNLVVDGATIGSATVDSTTTQAYSFSTTLAGGSSAAHDIQVLFDNDAVINGQDRNLYLQSISVDGQAMAATDGREVYHATGSASTGFGPGDVASNGNMYWQGAAEFKLPAAATVPTPTSGLVINVSEDAYQGDAQFTIAVDGQQQGGVYTATASHSASQSQAIALTNIAESFTPHDIAVTFLNDKWDGTPSTDRNLYVNSIQMNGQNVPGGSAALFSAGTQHFAAAAPVNWTG